MYSRGAQHRLWYFLFSKKPPNTKKKIRKGKKIKKEAQKNHRQQFQSMFNHIRLYPINKSISSTDAARAPSPPVLLLLLYMCHNLQLQLSLYWVNNALEHYRACISLRKSAKLNAAPAKKNAVRHVCSVRPRPLRRIKRRVEKYKKIEWKQL